MQLWQLADSAFPTGGFVHSGGLEAAMQLGRLRGGDLDRHLRESLANAAWSSLPLVSASHATLGARPARPLESTALLALDALTDATLSTAPANRASRTQGQSWVATAAAAFPDSDAPELKKLLRSSHTPGHLAPWFGAVCAALDVDLATTRELFLFLHLRGQISTAVRLGLIGPMAAQRLQATLSTAIPELLAATDDATVEDCALAAPLHDILHGHHDRLRSRLFAT